MIIYPVFNITETGSLILTHLNVFNQDEDGKSRLITSYKVGGTFADVVKVVQVNDFRLTKKSLMSTNEAISAIYSHRSLFVLYNETEMCYIKHVGDNELRAYTLFRDCQSPVNSLSMVSLERSVRFHGRLCFKEPVLRKQ